MPRPQQWYEDFKKSIEKSDHLKLPEAGFYLRTPDDKFVFGPNDLLNGKLDLANLNEQQIDTLYEAVKNKGVIIASPNGGKGFTALYNNKEGACKSTVPFGAIEDEEYPSAVQAAMEKYNAIPEDQLVKQDKIKGLNDTVKTITDMYGGTSITRLVETECILNSRGDIFPKSNTNPWKQYDKIFDTINTEEGVYLENVPKKDSRQEESYILAKKKNEVKATKNPRPLIKASYKGKVMVEFGRIYDELDKMKTKNPKLLALKEKCKEYGENLSITPDKATFDKLIEDFAKDADAYFKDMAPASLGKGKLAKLGTINKIRGLRDAVIAGKEVEEQKVDKIKEAQERIAAKFVTAYAMKTAKDPNEKVRAESKRLLNDPEAFAKKVKATMDDKAFQYLYGDRMEGVTADLEKRLNAGLNAWSSTILKNVIKEQKDPTPEREQLEAFMKQKPPTMTARLKGQYSAMPLDKQQETLEYLNKIDKELKEIGGKDNSSPEFAKVKATLEMTKMRLERGNSYMDVNAQLAELGDSVDAYLSKKAQEPSLNKRSLARVQTLQKLSNSCDAIISGKPQPKDLGKEEVAKDLLATKLVQRELNEKMKSKDPNVKMAAKQVTLNKKEFDKAKDALKQTKAFKELFDGPGKAQAALGSKIDKAAEKLKDKELELSGSKKNLSKKEMEKQKEMQQKVLENKNKEKTLEKKQDQAPSLI